MHQHLAWEAKKDQVIPTEPLCTNVYSLNPSRWRRWRIALTVYAAGWKGRKEWVGKVYKSGTWKLTKKNSALGLRQRSSTRPAPLFLFLAFVASTDRCIQERERENGIYLIHLLWLVQICFYITMSLLKFLHFIQIVVHVVGPEGEPFSFNILPSYDSFSDVGESRVWFASKNLTPCRMH